MNIKSLLLIALIGASTVTHAQNRKVRDAKLKYASENYCEASGKLAEAYTKINKKTKSALAMKAELAYKTAESYREIQSYKEAHDWYERAILLKYQTKEPLTYYYNGEVLMMMGEFKKAKEQFTLYKNAVPGDSRAEAGIQSAEKQMNDEFKETRTRHVITPMNQLNTENYDMAPMFIDKKGKVMAFSSGRNGSTGADKDPRTCENYMDIYTTSLDSKGNFLAPKLIESEGINTEDNEGTVCVDARGKTMFFTRCPNMKKQNLGCDIWMAEAKGKGWGDPVKLNLKSHDSISVGHPCVSEDGKFLIFASDMTSPGHQGGRDLWYTTYDKRSDSWTTPVNLGPEFNTPGDELFPTFAENGDLYFASDGLPGMGGLDIFRAEKVGEELKWQNPQNLGSPINSDFSDYALIEQTDRVGYFTSERPGGKNEKNASILKPDIFKYELPPNVFSLKVNVASLVEKTYKLEGVTVTVTGKTEGNNTPDVWKGITDKNGSVYWDKKPNGDRYINENSTYTITLSADPNKFHEDKNGATISTIGLNYDQNFVLDMYLLPKKPIRLPEVRYPLSKWDLLVDSTINSKDSLLFVYNLLQEYPNMVLELSSHTDSRGSNVLNQVLSDNRAKACYIYLVQEKGIDARRIVPIGKGEAEPRTVYLTNGKYIENEPHDGSTFEAITLTEAYINQFRKKDPKKYELLHQFNRRTEGRVLSLDFDPATAPPANPDYLVYKKLPKR